MVEDGITVTIVGAEDGPVLQKAVLRSDREPVRSQRSPRCLDSSSRRADLEVQRRVVRIMFGFLKRRLVAKVEDWQRREIDGLQKESMRLKKELERKTGKPVSLTS